jgi:hypothetical protein
VSLPQDMRGESGYPVASAACLGAGQGLGSMWSTRRLNDMDPSPWSATPSLPACRDTRAAGDPLPSGPTLGDPGAEACRRHLRLIVSWEPHSAALARALTCDQLWSWVTRLTVADPLLVARVWHGPPF